MNVGKETAVWKCIGSTCEYIPIFEWRKISVICDSSDDYTTSDFVEWCPFF